MAASMYILSCCVKLREDQASTKKRRRRGPPTRQASRGTARFRLHATNFQVLVACLKPTQLKSL